MMPTLASHPHILKQLSDEISANNQIIDWNSLRQYLREKWSIGKIERLAVELNDPTETITECFSNGTLTNLAQRIALPAKLVAVLNHRVLHLARYDFYQAVVNLSVAFGLGG